MQKRLSGSKNPAKVTKSAQVAIEIEDAEMMDAHAQATKNPVEPNSASSPQNAATP